MTGESKKRTSITLKCRLLGDICASGSMRLEAARVYREAAGNDNLIARDCSLFEWESRLMRR